LLSGGNLLYWLHNIKVLFWRAPVVPMITVQLAATPAPALSARVAHSLTDLTAAHLHKDPSLVSVSVDYVDPAHWFVAGANERPAFFVEIRVTQGTNTKDDKAAYVAAVQAELAALLDAPGPRGYVQVAEVHADAYGFGGLTAERRYVESHAAAGLPV
jgi:4-oxalocrotonate tautomerase